MKKLFQSFISWCETGEFKYLKEIFFGKEEQKPTVPNNIIYLNEIKEVPWKEFDV